MPVLTSVDDRSYATARKSSWKGQQVVVKLGRGKPIPSPYEKNKISSTIPSLTPKSHEVFMLMSRSNKAIDISGQIFVIVNEPCLYKTKRLT